MYKPNKAKLFGAALKQLLFEKKLSQRQFAKQAGLDPSYVSKLVNPKPGKEIEEPRKKTRQQLAKGLGITEQELLEQIARYSNSEAEKTTSEPSYLAEFKGANTKPYRELGEAIDTSTTSLNFDRGEDYTRLLHLVAAEKRKIKNSLTPGKHVLAHVIQFEEELRKKSKISPWFM